MSGVRFRIHIETEGYFMWDDNCAEDTNTTKTD